LQHEYGVDLRSITWVVTQHAHVAEFTDPPNVEMAPAGADLQRLMLEGEIDAWIGGHDADEVPGVEPVIADATAAERRWFEHTGVLPINHMLVVDRPIVEASPWICGEIVTLFTTAKERNYERLRTDGARDRTEVFQLGLLQAGIDPLPSDVESMRRSLETIIGFTAEQGLIPAPMSVDELFEPYLRARAEA
jgi:4,5-dihydroxyphthalate decarboxylase